MRAHRNTANVFSAIGRLGLAAVAAAIGLTAVTARADGLFYRLPADGSSAKFDLQINMIENNRDRTMKGSLTMRSVGVKEVDGEKCRWIEFNMTVEVEGAPGPKIIIAKTLIPEKALKRGENSFAHFKQAWVKSGNGEPEKVTEAVGGKSGPLPVFLCGTLNDEKLDAAEVESTLGKLSCEGVSGHTSMVEGDRTMRLEFVNRLHDKAPFGLVTSSIGIKAERDGTTQDAGTIKLKLIKVAKDAKSELPDIK